MPSTNSINITNNLPRIQLNLMSPVINCNSEAGKKSELAKLTDYTDPDNDLKSTK